MGRRPTTRATFCEGPFTVALAGQMIGNRLQLVTNDNVNPSGRVGQYADFTSPQRWSASTSLTRTRNGTVVASQGTRIDKTFTDSAAASYELTRAFTSQRIFPRGGRRDREVDVHHRRQQR
ncbi:hypothetical protein [Streptomyces sp. c-19]|uniref:hypothetical protein n=1 Tax=Streptomyces sp. c-19 TaxID=2789275 RepID=UPI003980FD1D